MNPKHIPTNQDRKFYEAIEELTDRELLEKQVHFLWEIKKINHRILLNVQFWFYALLASLAITFLVLSTK